MMNAPRPDPKYLQTGPRSQVFLRAYPHPSIKHCANYHAVSRMKRVHHRLHNIQYIAIR